MFLYSIIFDCITLLNLMLMFFAMFFSRIIFSIFLQFMMWFFKILVVRWRVTSCRSRFTLPSFPQLVSSEIKQTVMHYLLYIARLFIVFCIFNLFTSHSFCHLCRHDSHHLWLDLVQLNLHFAEDLINSGLVVLVDLEQKHCSVLGLIELSEWSLAWGQMDSIED